MKKIVIASGNHDAQSDRLVGKYTQPAMQQSFDIEFERQAKP